MAKTKVLIAVKTYPTLSTKYEELVCTAGFLEDGSWIRIYPIPFRKKSFDERYKKYDWIEIDLVKNTSDFRPESFRPYSIDSEVTIIEHLGTGKDKQWNERKNIVLQKVYTNMQTLINEAKDKTICTSLAVFKPTKILNFRIQQDGPEWDAEKVKTILSNRESNLFKHEENPFDVVRKIPFKFKFSFEDNEGKVSNMMIEDWETGQLYWNSIERHNNDSKKALEDVKQKYFDDLSQKRDLYFFLGTTSRHHFTSKNPFIIIGAFYPPKKSQLSLF